MRKQFVTILALSVNLFGCTDDKSSSIAPEASKAPTDGSGGGFSTLNGSGGNEATNGTGTAGSSTSLGSGLSVCTLGGMETRPDRTKGTLIDDFDDGETSHQGNGTKGFWIGNDDGTSGTQLPKSPGPSNAYAPLAADATTVGGIGDSGSALHVVGSGYSTWGSVIGVLLAAGGDDLDQQCAFDASSYDGISFWLKGAVRSENDGSPGALSVQVLESDVVPLTYGGDCDPTVGDCWDGHETAVEPTGCWRRISILFDDLAPNGWGLPPGELDLDELSAITFVVAQDMDYNYWLDELQFFKGTPPTEKKRCDNTDEMGGFGGTSAP